MREQPETDIIRDAQQSMNLGLWVLRAHTFCLMPFLRHSFGIAMPGIHGVFAMALMILMLLATEDLAMLQFLMVWFAALIVQRFRSFWLKARGERLHSRYDGWPWLARWFPFTRTEAQARNMEPILCPIIGVLLIPWSETIGVFVAFGFVSLTLTRLLTLFREDYEVTQIRDLKLEQQWLAERLRGRL